ncbi:ABC transporter permease [Chakrabartyella piscis]|uniref:ABC transporter permease n=1 Tax=Chakrabartyella piscis TaxID=2918914 RepID=UPI0029586561|nr:ABC transporter permease [Chakrabartyella piscis]
MGALITKLKKSDFAEKITLMVAMVILVIVFTYMNPNYATSANMTNILVACSLAGFVAIGETMLIIANQNDLSAGSVAACAGVVAALLTQLGVPALVSIAIAVLLGCVVGAVNASLVTFLKLQPFIATLATMSVVRGFAYILCGGKAVAVSDKTFRMVGSYKVFGIISLPIVLLLIAFVVLGLVLAKTHFGRSIYVLGGNGYAARLAGLNPTSITFKLHILQSGLAAFAGVLLAARMNSGQPSACVGLEFDAITAAVLGGTAFTGGIGTIFGTFLGMLLLQGFNTGLNMIGVQIFWQEVAQGTLLVIALAFDYYRKRMRDKKLLAESMETRGIKIPKLSK